jgi:hypothetical protein
MIKKYQRPLWICLHILAPEFVASYPSIIESLFVNNVKKTILLKKCKWELQKLTQSSLVS